ncbi:hypothetical protein M011DRAFT_481428 [Sporormia fimetaria CBS 119925]|uniref:Transcription factor domain-containing protein n=1 Tax=Sporormia fimetaria CBS 119925 TaxID=1340428 RepID=A0A6A6UWZ9_9PLEO|nr:hypothetical protein M011DRAFT_481428 [Sporormia fimetaria CBS 119925]
MYGEVLSQLNRNLSIAHLQTADCTILTVLTCFLRELHLPTGPDPGQFMKHLQGLEAILELRGFPAPPLSRETVMLFQTLRSLSILGNLVKGTPSIFAKEQWKQIPTLYSGEGARVHHALFCILADCTVLVPQRNTVLISGDTQLRQSLLSDVEAALSEVERIRHRWAKVNKQHGISTEYPATPALATSYVLYKTAYTWLWDIRTSLEPTEVNTARRDEGARELVLFLKHLQRKARGGTFDFNTIRFLAACLAVSILGGSSTPPGMPLALVVQRVLGGDHKARVSSVRDIDDTGLPEAPVGEFSDRLRRVNIAELVDAEGGYHASDTLTDFGPITVLTQAMASMIGSLVT